ncbi:MAG TPA: HPP family protein, partial [Candidatus Dormibacteraeota bacterium]|nr:HPP family protein [Candidatus Dormibacteraeota bacterium]
LGAAVGTIASLWGQGIGMAVFAAVAAFAVIGLARAYHPPGIALAIYPILLRPGNWFPLLVVLPFTAAAVGSAALLSRVVHGWPAYPKPLGKDAGQ